MNSDYTDVNFFTLLRIVFPAMFGVLNIIYWSYYLTRANMASSANLG